LVGLRHRDAFQEWRRSYELQTGDQCLAYVQ
jgi:hypothetical protein